MISAFKNELLGLDIDSAGVWTEFWWKCDYCGEEFLRSKRNAEVCRRVIPKDSCGGRECTVAKRNESRIARGLPSPHGINPKEFQCFYESHSNQETADKFGVSWTTVNALARKWKIARKRLRYKEFDIELTARQIEILNGSLLGDGSLGKVSGGQQSHFSELHGLSQLEYLRWKTEEFRPFTVAFDEDVPNNKGQYRACEMRTMFHPLFTQFERKWYKRDDKHEYMLRNGKRIKQVPTDLKLTPLTVAVWYYDDGFRPKKDRQAYFATLGFTFEECDFLVEELKDLGITYCSVVPFSNNKKQPKISVSAKSSSDLWKMIWEAMPIEALSYKINGGGVV